MIQTTPYSKEIIKLSTRRFKINTYINPEHYREQDSMIVDYNPIYNNIQTLYPNTNRFVLVHWQALPRSGERQWNAYEVYDDTLYTHVRLSSFVKFECLQLDEYHSNSIKPTAVVLCCNATVHYNNQTLTIKDVEK